MHTNKSTKSSTAPAHPPAMDIQPHAITFFTTHAERQAILATLECIINDLKQQTASPDHPELALNRTRALLIALGIERQRASSTVPLQVGRASRPPIDRAAELQHSQDAAG